MWETFSIDFRNFRSEFAVSYLVGQLRTIAGQLKEDLGEFTSEDKVT